MKKIVLFFLVFYILEVTPLNNLVKIPFLIEHYISHKDQNSTLDFISFIKLHYLNGNPKDADYKEDMKLPFKSTNSNFSLFSSILPVSFFIEIKKTELIKSEIKITPYFHSVYFSHLDSIWQPPRLV